jgi:ABC-2 type transport system permease protein
MQQAMFVMWFCMLIFILMSGLFTPISSMPEWAQGITYLQSVALLYGNHAHGLPEGKRHL